VTSSGWFCAAGRARRPVRLGARTYGALFALLLWATIALPVGAATEERIARVGDDVITTAEFAAFLNRYAQQKLYHGGSKRQLERLAREALDTMITERLLARAVAERGTRGAPRKVAASIARLREQYSDSEEWARIEPRLDEIESALLLDTQISALRERVATVSEPDEAALRAFYESNPDLFTRPAAFDVDLILVGVPPSALTDEWRAAQDKASRIHEAIASGASFAAMAEQHSTHESADSGGAVGRVHEGQLPGAAQEALGALSPGETSKPVRTLEGYLLLRLNERFAPQRQPFEAVRERAEALYRRERAKAQWAGFLEDLRAGTEVETYNVEQQLQTLLSGE